MPPPFDQTWALINSIEEKPKEVRRALISQHPYIKMAIDLNTEIGGTVRPYVWCMFEFRFINHLHNLEDSRLGSGVTTDLLDRHMRDLVRSSLRSAMMINKQLLDCEKTMKQKLTKDKLRKFYGLSGVTSLQINIESLDLGLSEVDEFNLRDEFGLPKYSDCLLYTSPSPRDKRQSRMPSSA